MADSSTAEAASRAQCPAYQSCNGPDVACIAGWTAGLLMGVGSSRSASTGIFSSCPASSYLGPAALSSNRSLSCCCTGCDVTLGWAGCLTTGCVCEGGALVSRQCNPAVPLSSRTFKEDLVRILRGSAAPYGRRGRIVHMISRLRWLDRARTLVGRSAASYGGRLGRIQRGPLVVCDERRVGDGRHWRVLVAIVGSAVLCTSWRHPWARRGFCCVCRSCSYV